MTMVSLDFVIPCYATSREALRVLCMGSRRERGKRELQSIGVDVYSVPLELRNYQKTTSIQRLVQMVKPDVILTDSPGYSVTYANLLGEINNIPSLIWLRGDFYEEYRENLAQMNFLEKIESTLKLQLSDTFIKKSTIITVSDYLKTKMAHTLKLPKEKITTIYPSVDLKRFNPHNDPYIFKSTLGLPQETHLLLSVMNFIYPTKVNGLMWALDSISGLLKKSETLKYVIAGDGPLRNIVESKVRKLGLTKNVILTGFIKNIEMAYAASDIVIHTSFLDACPLAVIEAHASGRPSIVTNIGGASELVIDGVTGFIVEKDRRNHIIKKIVKIIEDEKFKIKLGYNARQRAEQLFCRKIIGRQLKNSIEGLL